MKLPFFTKLALSLCAAATFASCSIDDDTNSYQNYPQPAYGIIANASPNSGDLFFYADANKVNASALNYADAAGYYNFYTGNRLLSLKDQAGTVLDTTTVTLNASEFFSAFAVNNFDDVELVTYQDSLVYPSQNNARVRFINLSPDAASIDISGLTQSFATGVTFKEATGYIEVQSGTYDINYKDTATGTSLFTDTAVEFYPGRIYTIYTKGYVTPATGSNDTFSTELLRNY